MFHRIMNGTTTVVDAFIVKLSLFIVFILGVGLGAYIGTFIR